jgi:ribonuclease D
MRGAGSLSFNQLAVLRALMIWRNESARENDVPPRALVRDEALIDLSRQPAKTAERLTRVKFLPRPIVDRHGDTIVRLTLEALANPPQSIQVQKPVEPLPSERFRAESVWAAAQAICLSQGLDPASVASRQEVADLDRAFAAGESLDALKVMTGWRRDALGNRLVELLQGQREIGLKWQGQRLTDRG